MKIKKDPMKQFLIKNTFIAILTLASTVSLSAEPINKLNKADDTKHTRSSSKVFSHSNISVFEKNKVLIEKLTLLESENDILKGLNSRLSKSQRNTWFLYGAFAVLLGAGLAVAIPSLTSRKKINDEWR